MKRCGFVLAAVVLLAGCATVSKSPPAEFVAWQGKRNVSIGGTNGWSTVVGLHWLKEGENRVDLGIARAPKDIGVFVRNGTNVSYRPAAGLGLGFVETNLVSDVATNPTKVWIDTVSIVAIQRGERMGLRVRDPEAVRRKEFKGIRWFAYDPKFRVEGRFEAFAEVKKLQIADVTGAVQEMVSPGAIVFRAGGKGCRLEVVDEPGEDEYFVLFRDRTTGKTTYPSGRFLYVPKPDASGRVTIDFNKAFSPPCGYTDFATCPIPTAQNTLRIAVTAGELSPHHGAVGTPAQN